MHVLAAMYSFKGTLSAPEACECVRRGLLKARPDLQVTACPMTDGGEGTLDVLLNRPGGIRITREVSGPIHGRPVQATYGWLPESKTAIVEMAQASGLLLVSGADRNPMKTTTFGTGELLRAALEQKPREVLLTVGGSATVDGGVGAAMAQGWRFLDDAGQPIGFGGEALLKISTIESPSAPFLAGCRVLCDVDSPLCGAQGAARVYGPQKGAMPGMVAGLERGLENLARVVKEQLGKDISVIPGGGAAGGLAAGAFAFMDAQLVPGSQAVIDALGLGDAIRDADYVITGEGRFDGQSARGKVVAGIAAVAKKCGVPVIVIAGDVAPESSSQGDIEFVRAIASRRPGMPLDQALKRAAELLEEAAAGAAARL